MHDAYLRSGIFHIQHRNMSKSLTLSLTLTLTVTAHHTSPAYFTPPTLHRLFVTNVPAVCVKETLPILQLLAISSSLNFFIC